VTSIFVSYSRADLEFVQALRAALAGGGHDVWLDVDEIAPSDDWLASIERALEEATAVLFVVSPEALCSEICMHELRCAAAHGKRIVALVRDGVGDEALPDELAGAERALKRFCNG
jgi:hypothetical protein